MVMVTEKVTDRIRTVLEMFFIQKNHFDLNGSSYDLILVEPKEGSKVYLTISASFFDRQSKTESTKEVLIFFKQNMKTNEYLSISTINILNSQDSFVKNINFIFSQVNEDILIQDYTVGGRYIEYGYLIHSKILEKLFIGQTAHIQLKGKFETIPAGIKRIDEKYNIVYYTGKGLRNIFSNSDQTQEQKELSDFLKL